MNSSGPRPGRRARPLRGARAQQAIDAFKSLPLVRIGIAVCIVGGYLLATYTDASGLLEKMSGSPQPTTAAQPTGSTSISPPSATPTPSSSPTPTPTQTLETFQVAGMGQSCPVPNPSDFVLPDVEICVVMWCEGVTYELDGTPQTNQRQIKLKARIVNNSNTPVDISISKASAMRLLVSESRLPGSWKPPQKTLAAGDRPILVEWSGSGSKQKYWALPPNVYADSYLTPANVYTGFFTKWEPPILGSGESYYRPLSKDFDPAYSDGNLVFQVPVGSQIYGLAVVDKSAPSRVVGVSPYSDWKDRKVSPATF